MNRKQRRARDKQIKKSKTKTSDIEQKLDLFGMMPDECFVCHDSFDKTNRDMVMTWNVFVREKERSVKVYCPTCWDNAKQILEQFGVSPDEGQTK